jgi:hypothetical protein
MRTRLYSRYPDAAIIGDGCRNPTRTGLMMSRWQACVAEVLLLERAPNFPSRCDELHRRRHIPHHRPTHARPGIACRSRRSLALGRPACSCNGCNPPGAVSRSWWGVPRVSAAWMPPSSLHGGIHGVPWLTHRDRTSLTAGGGLHPLATAQ